MLKLRTVAGDKSPIEVSAEILARLRQLAEDSVSEDIVGAVITVPAYFDDAQRQATKDAAQLVADYDIANARPGAKYCAGLAGRPTVILLFSPRLAARGGWLRAIKSGNLRVTRQKDTMAVLFADVSDSTRLYENMGDTAAFTQVRECLQILNEAAQRYQGRVVKTIGDGAMCVFSKAEDAARSAIEMQDRIDLRPPSPGRSKLTIRIGFHYGAVLREGDDVFGDTVNVAARMAGLAVPGHPTEAVSTRLPGDREQIRQFSTISLLNLLRLRLDAG